MLKFFTGIGPKLWALGAAILGGIYAVIRIRSLEYQRDKARHRAKSAEAQVEFEVKADEAEAEIRSEHSDLRERLEQDKLTGAWPENLRKRK